MKNLKPGATIHMMGICGTAMASLAGILKSMGYSVRGSDQNVYPPMSTQLADLKIPLMQGYRAENLEPRPDFVIVGNVISATNPEAKALLASDIPYLSLPKALGEFVIQDRQSVVIAGTHGKTTTTAMMSVLVEKQGLKPGFLIGGIPLNFGLSFQKPDGRWFVIEGDEYDTAFFDKVPKFIHYRPRHVILTSVEFDHADIYRDLEHVKDAFRMLLKLIPADGTLIYHAPDRNIQSILSETKCKNVFSYGESEGDFQIRDRDSVGGRNQFAVAFRGARVADVALKSFGIHNSLNALSAFAMAHALKWELSKTLQALAEFKGVKRRQEFLFEVQGRKVVEDFAHHPTAVELTLKSMREQYPGARILGVFEPRSATSRRNVFQQDYVRAFRGADLVFLAKPFDTAKIEASQRFSSDQLVQDLVSQGTPAFLGDSSDQLVAMIRQESRPGDVVLVMSNGGFDGIYGKLKSAFA